MSELVTAHLEEGLGIVTLRRAEKRNAINDVVLEQLRGGLLRLEADPAARVILLRAEGPCFSGGIDFGWLAGAAQPGADAEGVRLRQLVRSIQGTLGLLETIEKPSIALIHGYCAGLGLELVLPCDFRIATEDALLGVPEIYLGLVPDCGGTTRLVRLVGAARAKQLILLGDTVTAAEAERMNLVHEVVAPADLEAAGRRLAARLLARPAAALGLAKRLIDVGQDLDRGTHQALEGLVQSVLVTSPNLPGHLAQGMAALRRPVKGAE
ncbi:MAG: enoyl-CoA hydratase/isomerase family protein [Deltaproteobacteria bacterium]|nr:enoyl-CoA hydratase/isomerase family protein [Deltaproteobacteria bacterium]